nr:hypothetical secreted protein [uncultured archaeon]
MIKMDKKSIAVLTMLALIGVGMAFTFVWFMTSETGTSHEDVYEDIWMYQQPVVGAYTFSTVTDDQQQKAIEIATQNETVKQYLEQGYEIIGVVSSGNISKKDNAIVYVTLRKDNGWVFVKVDLNEEKVIELLKSRAGIADLEILEVGMIKTGKETEASYITVVISGREREMIKVPEVRELTGEERKKAREIVLSDPEVQNIISGLIYTLEIKPAGMIITNKAGEVETEFDGASVVFRLEDGTVYFVHVDLEKGKIIRISPPIHPPETSGKKVYE